MKKIYLLLFSCMLLTFVSKSQTPGFRWATHLNNQGLGTGATPYSIVCDSAANVYSTGVFSGIFDFDPGPSSFTMAAGASDVYITKQDSSGNFIWARQITGPHNQLVAQMVIDKQANLHLVGSFRQLTDFNPPSGTTTLAPITSTCANMFIMKMDGNGNFIWLKQLEPSPISEIEGYDITTDAAGNVYTSGEFAGTRDLDPGPGITNLTSTGTFSTSNCFVLKLDMNGNFIWVQKLEATRMRSIAVDGIGNVYTGGWFRGVCDFDPGVGTFTLNTGGNYSESVICKLTSAGTFVWAKQFSGTAMNNILNFDIDCVGNLYCSGQFRNSMDVDPGIAIVTLSTPSPTTTSDYLVKLDPVGNFMWGFPLNKIGVNYLSIDYAQNVYLTGSFAGTTDFDPGSGTYNLTAVLLGGDPFVARYNTPGTLGFAYSFSTTSNFPGNSMAIGLDPFANVHFTGRTTGTVDFNPFVPIFTMTTTSPTSPEPFIIKFSQATTYFPTAYPASSASIICPGNAATLTASGNGILSWYPSFTSTNSIGSGTSFITPPLTVNTTFYVGVSGCGFDGVRAPIYVSIWPSPTVTVNPALAVVCNGASVSFTAGGAITYTWNSNITTNIFTVIPTANNTYTVKGKDANGCTNTTSVTVTMAACVGLSEAETQNSSLSVYPNPNAGEFFIKGISACELRLVNVLGQTLREFTLDNTNGYGITIFGLSEGIYFLRDIKGEVILNYKIVVGE